MSNIKSQGSSKNLKFYTAGQSLSCPQTPTDNLGERSHLKNEIQEKGFQFRDAFHYYAEDGNIPGKHITREKLKFINDNKTSVKDKENSLYKTISTLSSSDLITSLNTDCSYLKNYKVIGIRDNILIATDNVINQVVAIKVILKPACDCGPRPVFPIGIPYTVPLIRFHENNSCIFLVLKYLRKKNLNWNLSQNDEQQLNKNTYNESGYHGGKLLTENVCNELNGQLTRSALSSSVNNISELPVTNRDLSTQEPASCTCAVANLDEADKTLSDVSSDALSDVSEFNSYDQSRDCIQPAQINTSSALTSHPTTEYVVFTKSTVDREVDKENFNKSGKMLNHFEEYAERAINGAGFHEDSKDHKENKVKGGRNLKSNTEEHKQNVIECQNLKNDTKDYKEKLIQYGRYSEDGIENQKHNVVNRANSIDEAKLYKNKKENINKLHHSDDKPDSQSVLISVEDMIRNSRELLSKVTKTLKTSNNLESLLDSFPESSCYLKDRRRRCESSRDLIQECKSYSRNNYLNKSVSFDTSEIRKPSRDGESNTTVSEETVKKWASQVIVALDGLHNQGIIWGDFNPSNVLFDQNDKIMLTYKCYLPPNWVNKLKQCQCSLKEMLMRESYQAPELRNPLQLPTTASDWWSVGVLLYHLLTGRSISEIHPTGITKHTEIYLPDCLSMHARLFLKHILRADPHERLGFDGCMDLKLHPFFDGITWPEDIT